MKATSRGSAVHSLCRRLHGSDARGRSARNDGAGGNHAEVNEPIEAQLSMTRKKSLLYEPLKKFSSAMSPADQERLASGSEVGDRREHCAQLPEVFEIHAGRICAELSDVDRSLRPARGRDYYRYCVHRFTTLDEMTPEEAHATGWPRWLASAARWKDHSGCEVRGRFCRLHRASPH